MSRPEIPGQGALWLCEKCGMRPIRKAAYSMPYAVAPPLCWACWLRLTEEPGAGDGRSR